MVREVLGERLGLAEKQVWGPAYADSPPAK
jgi:hypothetical protein